MSQKGKCFSAVNRGQRNKSDFYQTPKSLTQEILKKEFIPSKWDILEPCCGDGAIVDVLMETLPNRLRYFDIQNSGQDFLQYNEHHNVLLTNPPFGLANEFILHAKEIIFNKIIMLLPLSYLQGQERWRNLWQDEVFPLRSVYVLTRYPLLTDTIRDDGKFKTGMMAYAWYVWDKSYEGRPQIKWLDIQKYILSSKDDGFGL